MVLIQHRLASACMYTARYSEAAGHGEHRVNELLPYSFIGNPCLDALKSNNLAFAEQILWPSFIWPLHLPACLLFTLIAYAGVFSLRDGLPSSVLMTLEC